MPIVFVISRDWTLRAAVRAELREAGIEALGMESEEDAGRALAAGSKPSAVVLDATAENAEGVSLENLARRVPFVLVASRTEPTPLRESAAVVLYRPVRVGEIVAQVQQLLRGRAA